MFRKVHVPLLGLVENMSCFTCPQCGHKEAVFGEGGGAVTAADLGMELLGQVRSCPVEATASVIKVLRDRHSAACQKSFLHHAEDFS